MRYRIRVTRVQVAERSVRAKDEESAIEKIGAELSQPYEFFASWQTTGTDVDIVAAEPTEGITPTILGEGPLVLSVREAAKHLGVSSGTMYSLMNAGDIDHVRIGRRVFITREALTTFIEANTHSGYSEYYGR